MNLYISLPKIQKNQEKALPLAINKQLIPYTCVIITIKIILFAKQNVHTMCYVLVQLIKLKQLSKLLITCFDEYDKMR